MPSLRLPAAARASSPSQRSDRKKASSSKKVVKKKKAKGDAGLTGESQQLADAINEEDATVGTEEQEVTADTPEQAKVAAVNMTAGDPPPVELEEAAAGTVTPTAEVVAATEPQVARKMPTCISHYKPDWHRMVWSGHILYAPRAILTGSKLSEVKVEVADVA